MCLVSHVQLFATPWLAWLLCPWGFSRQEYWSGLPCPSLGDLPSPGVELRSPTLQADSLLFDPPKANSNEHFVPLLSSFFVSDTVFGDIHYLNYNNSQITQI